MIVESKIPLPPATRKDRLKYPFAEMEEGDSFELICVEEDKKHLTKRVYQAGMMWARYHNYDRKFYAAETENGVRCWRTK